MKMNYKKLGEEKLREAASLGHLEIVKKLISNGVDVNSKNDVNGWTALHWAACRGNVEIITILLQNGANKDSLTNNGETPGDLSPTNEIQVLLGGNGVGRKTEPLPIIPNYLRNPPLCFPEN